jgi:hypothetical protein
VWSQPIELPLGNLGGYFIPTETLGGLNYKWLAVWETILYFSLNLVYGKACCSIDNVEQVDPMYFVVMLNIVIRWEEHNQ